MGVQTTNPENDDFNEIQESQTGNDVTQSTREHQQQIQGWV